MELKKKEDCKELHRKREITRAQTLAMLKKKNFKKARERYSEAVKTEEILNDNYCE